MLNATQTKELILSQKLIVIVRKVPTQKLGPLAEALVRGGARLAEVTFDPSSADPARDYINAIYQIREAVGDQLCLGAGTVLTQEQVTVARDAGARYIISPNADANIIRLTRQLDMVSIPGALTPTEIVSAWQWGADFVKVFPAEGLGEAYIRNVRGPLSHIPLLAVGGVRPETIPGFMACGVCGFGAGSSIVNRHMLEAENYAGIEQLVRAHVEAIHNSVSEGKHK